MDKFCKNCGLELHKNTDVDFYQETGLYENKLVLIKICKKCNTVVKKATMKGDIEIE